MTRLLSRLRCWFKGHDDQKSLNPVKRTIKLACVNCGRQSRGWVIDGNEPVVRQHGDQMRHVILNPRLVQKTKSPTWWLHAVHERRGA